MENNVFSLFRDILTLLFYLISLIIAFWGLRTWKKQLHGKKYYELGIDLLSSIYSFREKIKTVRNPIMPKGEVYNAAHNSIENQHDYNKLFKVTLFTVFQKRFSNLENDMTKIEVLKFKAKSIWYNEIDVLIEPLFLSYNLLLKNILLYIKHMEDIDNSLLNKTEVNEVKDIVYAKENVENDNFMQNINETIFKIEEYIHDKIR